MKRKSSSENNPKKNATDFTETLDSIVSKKYGFGSMNLSPIQRSTYKKWIKGFFLQKNYEIDANINSIKKYKLEDWVNIFGSIYIKADVDRSASSLWLDVIDTSSYTAECIRREEYKKALDSIPDVFCQLLCFVAKYSIYLSDDILNREGIDLRSENSDDLFITKWILMKYPDVCSVCVKNPCICSSQKVEKELRNEKYDIAETISTRMMKFKNWENKRNNIEDYNLEKLFNMFSKIYGGVHHDTPISSICLHLFEELGEVSKMLLIINVILLQRDKSISFLDYDRSLKYLNNNLKEEIADIVSLIMTLINKINLIFRSTYPHYHCLHYEWDELDINDNIFKKITISELLFNRFYNLEKGRFYCPECMSEKCSPACGAASLIGEIDAAMEKERELMHEIKTALGHERRRYPRKPLSVKAMFENKELHIVNMSKDNIGFLSDHLFSLSDVIPITIKHKGTEEIFKAKITRPCNTDTDITGFNYFYGAKIIDSKKYRQE
jgi:NTP pyrophosphatase (non-canonical NTP hydrolase)